MLSYFHGKELRWSFATLKRRRGVHVRKGCLVKKVKKCHSFSFLTEESPVFLSLIVDLQEAGYIADKKLSRFVFSKAMKAIVEAGFPVTCFCTLRGHVT